MSPETPRGSLARGAALITVATAASRATGFIRVIVVAGAMGTTFLANTYQTANTAPNLVFELVAAGVLTSVFVPTFVEYLVKGDRRQSWDAANALTSAALLALVALAALLALAAPWIMRMLTIGVEQEPLRSREIALGSTFLRLFAPQVVFYGVGMIMTGALHAHRKFLLAAVAPVFNNVVVIGVYLTYAAMRGDRPPRVGDITTAETWVLGAGTTLGVVAMTLCLVPQLVRLGWRFRLRFDFAHPAVRRGARLGVWALGYAGGYQAGLVVALIFANRIEGGVAAYQWAYTFFYVPHALFAIPIFHVLFTAMAEHAARAETDQLREKLAEGLAMLMFILLPVAGGLVVVSHALTSVTLGYGVMTAEGAEAVARVLAAFAVGLPAYSTFLVLTRAHYAVGDTKTPALHNAATVVVSSAAGALLFISLPDEWAVAGLALGHSVGFLVGAGALTLRFSRRVVAVAGRHLVAAVSRSLGVALVATAVMAAVVRSVDGAGKQGALLSLALATGAGAVVYLLVMARLGSPEMARLLLLVRGRR